MDTIPVFVGLDYHQPAVQGCVLDEAGRVVGNQRCDNLVGPGPQLG